MVTASKRLLALAALTHHAGLAIGARLAPTLKNLPRLPSTKIDSLNTALTKHPTTIVIDANNVRGAASWQFSHAGLVSSVSDWVERRGHQGSVVMVWDHGQNAVATPYRGIVHTFGGPYESADDVISQQCMAAFLKKNMSHRVAIITRDEELVERATKKAGEIGADITNLRLLDSQDFVAMLLSEAETRKSRRKDAGMAMGANESADANTTALSPQEEEKRQHETMCEELERSREEISEFLATLRGPNRRVSSWGYIHEEPWERVVLAEKLRRLIEARSPQDINDSLFSSKRRRIRRTRRFMVGFNHANPLNFGSRVYEEMPPVDKRVTEQFSDRLRKIQIPKRKKLTPEQIAAKKAARARAVLPPGWEDDKEELPGKPIGKGKHKSKKSNVIGAMDKIMRRIDKGKFIRSHRFMGLDQWLEPVL